MLFWLDVAGYRKNTHPPPPLPCVGDPCRSLPVTEELLAKPEMQDLHNEMEVNVFGYGVLRSKIPKRALSPAVHVSSLVFLMVKGLHTKQVFWYYVREN